MSLPVLTARRLALAFPAAVALGLASVPAQAATTPSCSKLKGKNLVPGALAKVVDRPTRRGARTVHRYFLCRKPVAQAGRAKELKAAKAGGALTFLDGNGGYAVVRDVATKRVDVYDLRTRKRRRLTVGGANPAGKVLVGQAGEAAALVRAQVVGLDFDGRSAVLDDGPVAATSFRRTKDVVRWASAGKSKHATLSRPAVPCARQGGKVVTQRNGVRVTSFTYSGEFLVGELSGIVTRTRACLLEGDPIATVLDESAFSTEGTPGGALFRVEGIAAPYLAGFASSEDSESNVYETVTLTDLRTGKTTAAFKSGDGFTGQYVGSAVVVTPAGTVALATTQEEPDGPSSPAAVRIIARPLGKSIRELDKGPAAEFGMTTEKGPRVALTLTGTTLGWMRGGQAKTADLAAG